MKVTTVIAYTAVNLLLSYAAQGQSSFAFRNLYSVYGVDAPVFDARGVPLAGSNYLAELWGGATSDSLAPVVDVWQGNRREIISFVSDGYFSSASASLSVLTVPPGGWAWLQVRAWHARLGATYEEVFARGLDGYGESLLFYAQAEPLLACQVRPGH